MPSESPRSVYPGPGPDEAPPLSLVHRAGSLLGAGAIAAALASLPAAIRIAPSAGGVLGAWLALVACAIVPSIVAVLVLRGARSGLQAFARPDAWIASLATLVWIVVTSLGLAVWGAALRATTHHHALAGVTFALGGLVFGVALGIALRRLVVVGRATTPRKRAAGVGILAGGAWAVIVVLGLRFAIAPASNTPLLTPEAAATLVDTLAFAIAVGFLSRGSFSRTSWLARAGIPLAVGPLLLGVTVLTQSPTVDAAIRDHAPVFAPLAALVIPAARG